MRAYVLTTGLLFAILTLLHVWRIVEEGSRPATDPWFIGFTLVAVVMSLWAWRLLRFRPRA